MKKNLLSFMLIIACLTSVTAQNFWQKTQLGTKTLKGNQALFSSNEHKYNIDLSEVQAYLADAQERDFSAKFPKSKIMSFPDMNGKQIDFYIAEASNFAPELQADFPNIRAYRGYSVNNPKLNISFSISHLGLKAMILNSDGGTTFIEPLTTDNSVYTVHYRTPKGKNGIFNCTTDEPTNQMIEMTQSEVNKMMADDQTLRTFRLAVSVTGGYTQYFGGTVADAMAGINATMTRVNGVYERDFATRLELIPNNQQVVYTNPNTDPYSNINNWNGELQNTLDSVIGNAGYDIGHLFGSTGGGGDAGCIGCVCQAGSKGSGITSPIDGIPEGDSFDIDYVAHEMGHQLGATHTFSSSEFTGTNMEPGSGSTIMGYAGITGPTDVQQNSDAFFHFISIFQVMDNIDGKTCDIEIALSNTPPTVNAGPSYTIPSGTPFKLTATANDADGDPLTYSWEQANSSNMQGMSFPNPNATTGPLFRAFEPTTSPVRYIPSFDEVLSGDLYPTWEPLSNATRDLDMVVQVRDNNANIGQTALDNMVVSVDNSNGSFKVTNIVEEQFFYSGQNYNLTWDTAGTASAPFNSPTVNVLLSTDGGETFNPILNGTANDGSETVTIPTNSSAQSAYIMVESVNNIFYSVSPEILIDYEIVGETCDTYTPNSNQSSLPAAIPDGVGQTYGDPLLVGFTVPSNGPVSDVNILIDANHTYINDMQIVLESPDGLQVDLWDRECGGQSGIDITFDDDGSAINCGSPTQGTFEPTMPLSSFNNSASGGEWILRIRDGFQQDTGTLNVASIEICTTEYNLLSDKNYEFDKNVSMYPNPTNGLVNISIAENSEEASVELFDMLGRKVMAKEIGAENGQFDISNLPNGVYLININAGGKETTKKLVKN